MHIQQLQRFNPEATCPKCGSRDLEALYCAAAKPQSLGRHLVGCEHLRRTCRQCCYSWAEAVAEQGATGPRRPTVAAAVATTIAARSVAHGAGSSRGASNTGSAGTRYESALGFEDSVIEAELEDLPAPQQHMPTGSAPSSSRTPSTQLAKVDYWTTFPAPPPAPQVSQAYGGEAANGTRQGETVELTVRQLNGVIARALGWRYFGPCGFWIRPWGGTQTKPPDYCADIHLAWQLLAQVREVAGEAGAERWTSYLDDQRPEWSCLPDAALALRLARAFYYARTGQPVRIVVEDDQEAD